MLTSGYETGRYSKEAIAGMIQTYIAKVMGYVKTNYPVMVVAWDEVNEAIKPEQDLSANGAYDWRPSSEDFWTETLGSDYVAQVFRWAHEADPEAKLFYNYYRIEFVNSKADVAKRLIQELVNSGVLRTGLPG